MALREIEIIKGIWKGRRGRLCGVMMVPVDHTDPRDKRRFGIPLVEIYLTECCVAGQKKPFHIVKEIRSMKMHEIRMTGRWI